MKHNRLFNTLCALTIMAAATSCHIYTDELAQITKDREEIENNTLTTIDGQISVLNSTITTIESARLGLLKTIEECNSATTDLGSRTSAQREAISSMADSLKAAFDTSKAALSDSLNNYVANVDETLEGLEVLRKALVSGYNTLGLRADTLRTYIKELSASRRTSADTTYMTLVQYRQVCEDVALLQAKAARCDSSINALETKTQEFLKTGLPAALKGADDKLKSQITSAVSEVNTLLGQSVQKVTEEYQNDLKASIESLEADIKASVEEQLDAYWTIAQSEAQIKTMAESASTYAASRSEKIMKQLASLDTLLQKSVSDFTPEQQAAINAKADLLEASLKETEKAVSESSEQAASLEAKLASLNDDITAQYTAAIQTALSDYNETAKALIRKKIAQANAEADSRLAALADSVSALEGRMTSLETRMTTLEDSVEGVISKALEIKNYFAAALERIQSITLVPGDKSDGSYQVDPGECDIEFEIHPEDAAEKIAQAWSSDSSCIAVKGIYYTESGTSFTLTVKDVTAEDGILTVTVDFSSASLTDSFWKGEAACALKLVVKTGSTSKATDYFTIKG